MTPIWGYSQYFYDLKKEMIDFKQSFEIALNSRDKAKLHDYFFEDAQQINTDGGIITGREDIAADFIKKMDTEVNTVAIKILRIHATDSLITVWGSLVNIPIDSKDDDTELNFQNYEKNLLFTDGRWRIQKIKFTNR